MSDKETDKIAPPLPAEGILPSSNMAINDPATPAELPLAAVDFLASVKLPAPPIDLLPSIESSQ